MFDRAVQPALEFQRQAPSDTLIIVTRDHGTGGLSPTYALKDLSGTSNRNRFYAGPVHLEMTNRITMSIEKAAGRRRQQAGGEERLDPPREGQAPRREPTRRGRRAWS